MAAPVDEFLECVEHGQMAGCTAFADEAELDATVPNWRFTVRGGDAIVAQMSGWYADAGQFEELRRTPLSDGELVEFTLAWEEHGVPHATHQVHVLSIENDKIVSDRVWCGGRWSASLLAEMEEAALAHAD